jgi:mannose-6-phosphate isomerase-like protein (cupin superfamily)
MKIIKKPWGQEEILEINDKYVVKRLTMIAGNRCSLQYHEKKLETIYILSGKLIIDNGIKKSQYFSGESITIPVKSLHRMQAEDEDVIYLECSTPELDDVIRIKDDYNRK